MLIRLVCLANSFKEGGRCLAGIELDNNNNPKIENGRPKWIRPICNTAHGEIHTHLVAHLSIMDIIELGVSGYPEERDFQSENVLFRENSINTIGKLSSNKLDQLLYNRNSIFGNRGKAVSAEATGNLSHSLMFINVSQFEVIERTYEDNPTRPQVRLVFSYNGSEYDLPVTDPVFLHNYQRNPCILEGVDQLYSCLSLGINHNDWHYKLVAGMIFKK